jgi:CzcA family heavy metal efflux pump
VTNAGHWLRDHRRSILFAVAVLACAGGASLLGLPVSLFPRTTFPRIVVSADAGDRPADRMVVEVTRPLEEAVRAVPGVRSVRSNTSRGACDVSINFDWGLDMIAATLEVESAIAQIRSGLPAGLGYEVRRMDPTVFPVMGLSLTSASRSLVELRDIGLYRLRPLLSTVEGVASVRVLGGRTEEYRVVADPARLAAAGVTLEELVQAVSAANVVEAVGRLEEDEKLYLVLSDTRFRALSDVDAVIVRRGPTGVVNLADVATVEDSSVPEWTRVTADGEDAVLINVYQQPGGNTTRISRDIQSRLVDFQRRVGADLRVRTWYDQSTLISAAASSVRDAILIGIALAVVVLLLFLRSWKVTLVVSLAVPVVLAATALVLRALGMGLNIMTLGGMAAAVGLIVDDGIVMVEHVVRRLREEPGNVHHAVPVAAREMLGPLAASSAATVVIFAPLAFLTGVTGAFFKALSLTMAAALAISFLFAATAVPALADRLLGPREAHADDVGRWLAKILNGYERLTRRLVARPSLVALIIVPLLILGWLGFRHVGSGFMPSMDEGGFILDYRAPAGTSLTETDRRLRLVEAQLKDIPDVATWSRRTGLALGGAITEANEGDFFVRLAAGPRRPIDEVIDDARARIQERVPGLEIEFAQLMEDLIGDLTAVPQPIEVKLFGSSLDELRAQASEVAKAVTAVAGVVDVKDGVVLAGDAVDVRVDRTQAEVLGLDPERVTRLARVALEGEVATEVQRGEKMVGVRVWTPEETRSRLDLIADLRLPIGAGRTVRLGRVARFSTAIGQPQLTRENLKGMVAVTGRISGRDLGSVMADVKRAVAGIGLPAATSVEYGGLYEQQQQSFRGLLAVLAAATALVFILLLAVYEQFSVAVAVLAVDLLAATGVFSALWWTGSELNISSMMGLTMIVGISSEAAIFFLTEWSLLAGDGDARAALATAGRRRLRPIVMTAAAAILALLPLALAIGQGSAMLQPLAIAIIAGLLLTVPLVLLVLPALIVLLGGARSASNAH